KRVQLCLETPEKKPEKRAQPHNIDESSRSRKQQRTQYRVSYDFFGVAGDLCQSEAFVAVLEILAVQDHEDDVFIPPRSKKALPQQNADMKSQALEIAVPFDFFGVATTNSDGNFVYLQSLFTLNRCPAERAGLRRKV